jgi:hypothetical protein
MNPDLDSDSDPDPNLDADPDPAIFVTDLQEATKNSFFLKFFCLLHFDGIFTSVFKDKKSKRSHKTEGINVFQLFLLDHSRIRIRTRTRIRIQGTSDEWIRIREAQKHSDLVDPDSDPIVQCD